MIWKSIAPLVLSFTFIAACGEDGTPFSVSTDNLSGVIGGEGWEFAQGHTDAFLSDDTGYYAELYAETFTACEPFSEPSGAAVLVRLPTTPGDYTFGLKRSATFFEPPGDNTIALEGRLEVYEVTDSVVRAGMHAVVDPQYTVNGRFEVEICTE